MSQERSIALVVGLSARLVRPCCARTKPTKAPRHQQTVNFNTLSLHDDMYYSHKRQTGCSVRDFNVRHHDIRGGAVYRTQQTRRTVASGTSINAKLTIQNIPGRNSFDTPADMTYETRKTALPWLSQSFSSEIYLLAAAFETILVITMPPSGQPDDSSQNPLHTNDEELDALLGAPPRDSTRPLLGIPQENDDYFANFALPTIPRQVNRLTKICLKTNSLMIPDLLSKHILPPPWGRSQAELNMPRSTAPEIPLNQSQASAGTFNPSQATQTSEPTLGHRQNLSARYVHTLSRGSETDS